MYGRGRANTTCLARKNATKVQLGGLFLLVVVVIVYGAKIFEFLAGKIFRVKVVIIIISRWVVNVLQMYIIDSDAPME
jgi:hypothetical protein